jgi:hypothetical protein
MASGGEGGAGRAEEVLDEALSGLVQALAIRSRRRDSPESTAWARQAAAVLRDLTEQSKARTTPRASAPVRPQVAAEGAVRTGVDAWSDADIRVWYYALAGQRVIVTRFTRPLWVRRIRAMIARPATTGCGW